MLDHRARSGDGVAAEGGVRCDACGGSIDALATPDPGDGRAGRRCERCSAAVATLPASQPALTTRQRQQAWMRRLGAHVRRTRLLLGLTQGQLAEMADTSQAAVSRLEQGTALGTPYLVVVAIHSVLTAKLRALPEVPPTIVAPMPTDPLATPADVLPELPPADEMLQRYVAAFTDASLSVRQQLVRVVEAFAAL